MWNEKLVNEANSLTRYRDMSWLPYVWRFLPSLPHTWHGRKGSINSSVEALLIPLTQQTCQNFSVACNCTLSLKLHDLRFFDDSMKQSLFICVTSGNRHSHHFTHVITHVQLVSIQQETFTNDNRKTFTNDNRSIRRSLNRSVESCDCIQVEPASVTVVRQTPRQVAPRS